MKLSTSRTPFSVSFPYRNRRPSSSKIIFLSMEGSVTEEEYFSRIMEIFSAVKSKIQFISVAEDAIHTNAKCRTGAQASFLGKNRPQQLVDRIEQFKKEKANIFQFDQYPDDEFWVVMDVDENLSSDRMQDWNEAITRCVRNGYGYAISNPFFELWLLLHHADVEDEDRNYAVTATHAYEPTSHYRDRLRNLGVPMRDKHINDIHYSESKIQQAISRARELHNAGASKYPYCLTTTVYRLLEKIVAMIPSED